MRWRPLFFSGMALALVGDATETTFSIKVGGVQAVSFHWTTTPNQALLFM
jgi:hypothetical protein